MGASASPSGNNVHPFEPMGTLSFNKHLNHWSNNCKDDSDKCLICYNTSHDKAHSSKDCPILKRISYELVKTKRSALDTNAASCVGNDSAPSVPTPAPAPTSPSNSGGSNLVPGAFTVATVADSYNSGTDFEYEGKDKGKLYVPSSKLNSARFLYLPIPPDLCSRISFTQDDKASPSPPHPITTCNHSTPQSSHDPVGICTIKLPKHVMALLQNPPAHSIAIPFLADGHPLSLLVADTGATDHMLPDKSAFISYRPVVNCRVRMGNNSFAPILGTGSTVFAVNGKRILIQDCLHVPALRNPLYSLRAHQQQHGCGFLGMHNLGIYVFFPTFIVKVDMATDCHLSYEPIGHSGTLPSLDYVQPKTITTSASNTTSMPSVPAVIEDDQDANNTIPVTYAHHWPKKPLSPPSPQYDLSLIPPPSYSVSLKDLARDELIS
jgi:hypothetical protein